MQTLYNDVATASSSMTNKNVDKVIRSVTKNKRILVDENLEFLHKFGKLVMNNKKISPANRSKLETAIAEIGEGEESINLNLNKNEISESIQDEISKIVEVIDVKRRIFLLDELLAKKENKNDRFKIIYAKLMNLSRWDSIEDDSFYKCIVELDSMYEELNKDLKDTFILQLNNVIEFAKKENEFSEIVDILDKFDKTLCDLKRLEFDYFGRNIAVETENHEFRLLFLVRNNKIEDAIDFYNKNKEWMFKNDSRQILDAFMVLSEAILISSPVDSFLMLQHCHESKYKCTDLLNVMCCVLNEKVKNEKYFIDFIEGLNLLEDNPLLLNSIDRKMNFYRAFFQLMNGNKHEFSSILKTMNMRIPNEFYELVY